jgi:hypothetical protein
MRVYWIIGAVLCGILAVFFAVRQEYDRAFISAAIGSVIWFLGYRNQLKKQIPDDPEENIDSEENEEN